MVIARSHIRINLLIMPCWYALVNIKTFPNHKNGFFRRLNIDLWYIIWPKLQLIIRNDDVDDEVQNEHDVEQAKPHKSKYPNSINVKYLLLKKLIFYTSTWCLQISMVFQAKKQVNNCSSTTPFYVLDITHLVLILKILTLYLKLNVMVSTPYIRVM